MAKLKKSLVFTEVIKGGKMKVKSKLRKGNNGVTLIALIITKLVPTA